MEHRFTCGEREIGKNIKKSQNIMKMIADVLIMLSTILFDFGNSELPFRLLHQFSQFCLSQVSLPIFFQTAILQNFHLDSCPLADILFLESVIFLKNVNISLKTLLKISRQKMWPTLLYLFTIFLYFGSALSPNMGFCL